MRLFQLGKITGPLVLFLLHHISLNFHHIFYFHPFIRHSSSEVFMSDNGNGNVKRFELLAEDTDPYILHKIADTSGWVSYVSNLPYVILHLLELSYEWIDLSVASFIW